MRRFILLLAFAPVVLFAQNEESSTVVGDSAQNTVVQIGISELTGLENAKSDFEKRLIQANKRILEYEMKLRDDSVLLKNSSLYISKLRADSLSASNRERILKEQLLKSDKCLISVASNFLYIPYEAYSIDSIAIRSFETISDKSLQQKYHIRYSLLKSYRDDISNFISFLGKQQELINNNPFNKDAKDAITALYNLPLYIAYHRYEDWMATFLGRKLVVVEQQLKSFNGKSKIDFSVIVNSLQECLKTD